MLTYYLDTFLIDNFEYLYEMFDGNYDVRYEGEKLIIILDGGNNGN